MSRKSIVIITIIGAILLVVLATRFTNISIEGSKPCDYPEIARRGVMNVAVDFSPISYHIAGDSISGFDYELLQMLSEYAQIKIDIHPETGLSRSLELLNRGVYDVIAQPIPITTENKQEYIFTKPLLLNKQVLIQRIDSCGNVAIRNQLDLANCTLHIAQDAPTRLRIENLAQEIGSTIHINEMPDYGAEQLIILVATGQIDYAVCEEAKAAVIAADYDNIDYKTDISFTQFMSWTLHKESPILRDSIDSWLTQIQATEEYKELYTKYFGRSSYTKHRRISTSNTDTTIIQ